MKISGDLDDIINTIDSYNNCDICWHELKEALELEFGEEEILLSGLKQGEIHKE